VATSESVLAEYEVRVENWSHGAGSCDFWLLIGGTTFNSCGDVMTRLKLVLPSRIMMRV